MPGTEIDERGDVREAPSSVSRMDGRRIRLSGARGMGGGGQPTGRGADAASRAQNENQLTRLGV